MPRKLAAFLAAQGRRHMGEPRQDNRSDMDAAFGAALEAESRAREERARAEQRARELVVAARRQAQLIAHRADRRIKRAQMRAAVIEEADVARIRSAGDAALQHVVEAPSDPAAIDAALRELTERLTTDTPDIEVHPEVARA